jgi:hypothetical protein
LALIAVAGLLAWRILAIGLADHYASPRVGLATPDSQAALVWSPTQPDALIDVGARAATSDPQAAGAALRLALSADPTEHRALMLLAGLPDQGEKADSLVEAALRVAPSDPQLLMQAGAQWAKRGDAVRSLDSFSRAMIANRDLSEQLNPVLLAFLEGAETRDLLKPYVKEPPIWWDNFFRHATQNALDVETVRWLYALRKTESAVPLSDIERDTYVGRLRRDRRFTEAYLSWINGLDEVERQALGLLNNGSFEIVPTNRGFDWRLYQAPNLVLETAETYGTDGKRALHLAFRGFDARFANVSQDLFLEPGSYRLSGRVRADGLRSSGGLLWKVFCDNDVEPVPIAETERFLGSNQWEPFDLDFAVPLDCERPVLRLLGAVRTPLDQRLDGSIWFDALSVARLAVPVAAVTPVAQTIPAVPGAPAAPAVPGTSAPVKPGTPAAPAVPAKPVTPAAPAAPVLPGTPAVPATPVLPAAPAAPVAPAAPAGPGLPSNPAKK